MKLWKMVEMQVTQSVEVLPQAILIQQKYLLELKSMFPYLTLVEVYPLILAIAIHRQ